MAAAPSYAATPRLLAGLVPSTLDTSFTAPAHVTSLGTAGASGTKVTQVDVTPVATTVAGLVNLFAFDGTTYHLVASVTIPVATVSATAAPVTQTLTFDNLVLPASSWSLAVSNTIAGNQSLITVTAFGADL